ncbi:Multi -bridging factor 1 protein [Rutstroemia sp. NJR-2017a WRK4]|nr:Multi -bridging factor 1 protein [Rutstroemia sp. NJR-2017a WRK4]PQE27383.1 Multi -bridging factor 1 protein [Rutstroemia sp. NJR-2017a WRK4]
MDDWETTTKIGKNVRPGGAAADRSTVIRGKSALNAAQRTGGIVATEKKFGAGNARSTNTEGQRLTKVDRADDIVKPKVVPAAVAAAIMKGRSQMKLTQTKLGEMCNLPAAIVASQEKAGSKIDNAALIKMERVLHIKLTGKDIGQPTGGAKNDAAAAAPAAKKPAAKTVIKIVPPGAASAAAKTSTPKSATPKTATPKSGTPTTAKEDTAEAGTPKSAGGIADLPEEEA